MVVSLRPTARRTALTRVLQVGQRVAHTVMSIAN